MARPTCRCMALASGLASSTEACGALRHRAVERRGDEVGRRETTFHNAAVHRAWTQQVVIGYRRSHTLRLIVCHRPRAAAWDPVQPLNALAASTLSGLATRRVGSGRSSAVCPERSATSYRARLSPPSAAPGAPGLVSGARASDSDEVCYSAPCIARSGRCARTLGDRRPDRYAIVDGRRRCAPRSPARSTRAYSRLPHPLASTRCRSYGPVVSSPRVCSTRMAVSSSFIRRARHGRRDFGPGRSEGRGGVSPGPTGRDDATPGDGRVPSPPAARRACLLRRVFRPPPSPNRLARGAIFLVY